MQFELQTSDIAEMAYYRSSKFCACRSQLHTIKGGEKTKEEKLDYKSYEKPQSEREKKPKCRSS